MDFNLLAMITFRQTTEHQEQAALIEWSSHFWWGDLLFAIPNGGYRTKIGAYKLKKEGVKKGVPDLFLAVPVQNYSGLFIEMKSRKGSVSADQKKMMKMLEKQGYHCVVCRSVTEGMFEITNYLATHKGIAHMKSIENDIDSAIEKAERLLSQKY